MRLRYALGAVVGGLCVAAHVLAATKVVEVAPEGTLTFADEETRTSTTTITEGDSVQWVWHSSGHSTTSDRVEEGWDSGVQQAPFSFTHQFPVPGTFPYHCIPHQSFGMTGVVVVRPAGETTTSTTLPPISCNDPQAVAALRAQIDDACDCAGAPSHRAYVRCARGVIRGAARAGALPAACRSTLRRCAGSSTCGRSGFVACCRTSARGVQRCSIKPSALGCKRPRGGSVCVSDQPSCCDACGGPTCPPPAVTTTTLARLPGGHPPATTSTTLPLPQCLTDADCPLANLCDGPQCRGGLCIVGPAARCPDGTPALWVGTASSLTGVATIAFRICAADAFASGTFVCLSDSFPCFAVESPILGTTVFSVDGITIVFDSVVFVTGDACTFDARLVGLTMGGDFICVDPFGFIVSAGTWNASRCP